MKCYKIIMGDKFVGVGTSIDLRKFQQKHSVFFACDESEAQYIQCGGKLYHDMWMLPVSTQSYSAADVKEIEQDEYDALFAAIKSNQEIPVQIGEEPIEDNTPEEDQVTVEYVRESKINEMKSACNHAITNGFDIALNDEQTYHFSLTIQDQLNLITSAQMIASGSETIPYHADGELCKYYSAADMNAIIEKANAFKTYHVAYFNSLKSYIASLNDMNKISKVFYGSAIPTKYQSEVYIALKNEF